MNIILVGMPGCGKSTCGVLAAKMMCRSFIDTDLIIQNSEKMPLQKIINTKGGEYFSQCEENAVLGLTVDNAVIATGGSVVYSEKAMSKLRENGITVYMRLTYADMKRRIRNPQTRGILLKDGYTLRDMYYERTKLYEKYADITLDCTSDAVELTVERIIEAIDRRNNDGTSCIL